MKSIQKFCKFAKERLRPAASRRDARYARSAPLAIGGGLFCKFAKFLYAFHCKFALCSFSDYRVSLISALARSSPSIWPCDFEKKIFQKIASYPQASPARPFLASLVSIGGDLFKIFLFKNSFILALRPYCAAASLLKCASLRDTAALQRSFCACSSSMWF